jgi:hypothetical protein
MAKSSLNWLARRAITDRTKISPEVLTQTGRELLANGYLAEAAEFFKKANDREGLTAILSQAVNEGDFFLYNLALQYLGQAPKPQELALLADKANAAGFNLSRDKARAFLAETPNKTA